MACQNCGNRTTNTCTRCGESNYCNGNCQNLHWSMHKDTCKDNQLGHALQRVAEIIQEAYLAFRENCWDTPVDRIVNGPQTLIVYDGNQMLNTRFFTAFPNHLVQNNTHLKMELLTAWTCNEPYGFLHSLIGKLIQGLNIDVDECDLKLRQGLPRSTIAVRPTGEPMANTDYSHGVLSVRSRRPGNRQWIIDICGAQYGIYQPLHDGAQYFSQYVQTIRQRHAFGHTQTMFANLAQTRGAVALLYGLGGRAAQALNTAMNTWESQNWPISQLRSLDGAAYEQQKASLLSALDNAVRTFVATNDFTALVRRERTVF